MTTSGPASAGLERVLTLDGGRRLAVSESGDADGFPVLFFHGMPGSRRTGPTDPDLARSLGVRLINVERPGYGASTRQPGRVVHDWSLDVEDVTAHLGCAEFGLAAWSGGAAFALAAAEVHRARVRGVAVVAPLGPFDDVEATRHLPPDRARRVRLLRSRHIGVRTTAAIAGWALRKAAERDRADPAASVDRLAASAPPADRAVLARPAVRAQLEADVAESLRQGAAGWADDLAALTTPWAVEYRAIRAPVTFWHGSEDADVAPAAARELAATIPGSTLHLVDGAGHLLLHDVWPEVIAAAAGR